MYSAIASSKPYRFIIGPQRRKFTIHPAIVARQSDHLDKLVNGDFKEGNENIVHWENVDEETFVCFWQYAYTGDYDVPREPKTPEATIKDGGHAENEMKSPENTNEPRTFVEVTTSGKSTNEQAESRMRKKYMKKKMLKKRRAEYARREETGEEPESDPNYEPPSKQKQLWEVFTALRLINSHQVEVEVQPPRESQGDDFDSSDLLCHARVFAFADCYGIFDLMELSYNRIHRILCNLDLRTETLADIIALVHYCYETPAPPDLKELAVLYSACNIEKLWVDEQFQNIIGTHGDLSRAVIASLLGRLA